MENALARCPHCRKISSVGDFSRKRGLVFGLAALIAFIVALAVTLGAWGAAKNSGGLYFLFVGNYASLKS